MSSPVDPVIAVAGAVPGVAHVEQDGRAGAAPALRVQLQPDADATQVALAISRLLATAGDPADGAADSSPRRPGPVLPRARSGSRPRVLRLDVHTEVSLFTAQVELGCAARSSCGSAHSAVTTSGIRRAVATATLQALVGLLTAPVHLELEQVEVSATGSEPVVLVQVSLVSEEGVQRLAGSAVVREDESSAIVRATLDALNRRVQPLVDFSG